MIRRSTHFTSRAAMPATPIFLPSEQVKESPPHTCAGVQVKLCPDAMTAANNKIMS
jgi:hypothetical protein